MITQEGEVRMQTPLCGRGQEEWVPALQDVIETNRSMGGVDPSIAFVDNPVADHTCLCETVQGIKATQVLSCLESKSMFSSLRLSLNLSLCLGLSFM